jgi:hypothetical protein
VSEISLQFFALVGRVRRDAHRACRRCKYRHRHFWAVRQRNDDSVLPTYPHGPQRMRCMFDVLMKMAVCQRNTPGS